MQTFLTRTFTRPFQVNNMKQENALTIRTQRILVRDTAPFHEAFESFIPHERAFKSFMQYLKQKQRLEIIGNLWKCAGFFLEIESTYPVLKGTLMTETEEKLKQARDHLQKLLLAVS